MVKFESFHKIYLLVWYQTRARQMLNGIRVLMRNIIRTWFELKFWNHYYLFFPAGERPPFFPVPCCPSSSSTKALWVPWWRAGARRTRTSKGAMVRRPTSQTTRRGRPTSSPSLGRSGLGACSCRDTSYSRTYSEESRISKSETMTSLSWPIPNQVSAEHKITCKVGDSRVTYVPSCSHPMAEDGAYNTNQQAYEFSRLNVIFCTLLT